MIPKTIHYCWFGKGEKPKLAEKCLNSWKKYCPDYEIIEWNESNFNIHMNPYVEWCYTEKKYAFLSDYVRLLVLYQHGGLYMDTDVEIVRSLDDLLCNNAYFGFENDEYVNTGEGCGSEAGNPVIEMMLREYDELLDGKKGTVGCPILNTNALLKCGLTRDGKLQRLEFCTVYPAGYFNPYDDATGLLHKTDHTYSVHWYGKSWMSRKSRIRSILTKPLHRILGKDFFHRGRKK